MFSLDLSPTFEAAVRFEAMAETGGTRVVHEFTARFARLDETEIRALTDEIRAQDLDDRAVATRLLRGWGSDLRDGKGDPLPYTPANVERVLSVAGVPAAVVYAWRAAQPRAAQGN